MSITRDRLNILNEAQENETNVVIKDLVDESGNAAGTKIEIYILTEN